MTRIEVVAIIIVCIVTFIVVTVKLATNFLNNLFTKLDNDNDYRN